MRSPTSRGSNLMRPFCPRPMRSAPSASAFAYTQLRETPKLFAITSAVTHSCSVARVALPTSSATRAAMRSTSASDTLIRPAHVVGRGRRRWGIGPLPTHPRLPGPDHGPLGPALPLVWLRIPCWTVRSTPCPRDGVDPKVAPHGRLASTPRSPSLGSFSTPGMCAGDERTLRLTHPGPGHSPRDQPRTGHHCLRAFDRWSRGPRRFAPRLRRPLRSARHGDAGARRTGRLRARSRRLPGR